MRIQKWSVEDVAAKAGGGMFWRTPEETPLCWTPEQVRQAAKDFGITEPIDAKQALDCLQWKIPDNHLLRLLCLMLPAKLAREWYAEVKDANLFQFDPDRPCGDDLYNALEFTNLEENFERLAKILDKVQS